MGEFKYKEFLDEGAKAQTEFEKALLANCGGRCEPATKMEDIKQHVDLWWFPTEKTKLGIDVKGIKKDKRSDKDVNIDIHWIELKNVHGNDGWLFGKETYVAFETLDCWIIITPDRILSIIKENVKDDTITNDNTKIFTLYQRTDRKDVIVKVPTSYLKESANKIINKI